MPGGQEWNKLPQLCKVALFLPQYGKNWAAVFLSCSHGLLGDPSKEAQAEVPQEGFVDPGLPGVLGRPLGLGPNWPLSWGLPAGPG